jgi:HSP20 family protein
MVASFRGLQDSLFDEFRRVQQEMDELFGNDFWTGGIRSLPRGTFPAINVASNDEQVNVYLFAPGIDPKALDISIQQNLLTVSGQRQLALNDKATYYRQERFSGEFRRVITLPDDIDPDRVNARYQNGIVQISVQRRESARPRKIELQ